MSLALNNWAQIFAHLSQGRQPSFRPFLTICKLSPFSKEIELSPFKVYPFPLSELSIAWTAWYFLAPRFRFILYKVVNLGINLDSERSISFYSYA